MNDFVVYTYTRAEALADGVLVDVSEMAKEAGFKFPTVITAALDAALTPNKRENKQGQSYAGRLWDVLFMAALHAMRNKGSNRIRYNVMIAEYEADGMSRQPRKRLYTLLADVGPGDEGEPVVTIGFPSDF